MEASSSKDADRVYTDKLSAPRLLNFYFNEQNVFSSLAISKRRASCMFEETPAVARTCVGAGKGATGLLWHTNANNWAAV